MVKIIGSCAITINNAEFSLNSPVYPTMFVNAIGPMSHAASAGQGYSTPVVKLIECCKNFVGLM